MNSVLFRSKPLTDEVIYFSQVSAEELEREWFIVYEANRSEYYAKGFSTKAEALNELLSDFIIPETCWKVYGLYYNKEPKDFDLGIFL